MNFRRMLMYLSLTSPFQSSLMFSGKAGTYPRVEQPKGALLGKALALPTNSRLGLKGLSRDKHISLLRKFINYELKKFYNFGLTYHYSSSINTESNLIKTLIF
jgi:hypothetical protein